MKVEPIANGSLRIWLSEEELKEWGFYPDGALNRHSARRLIRQVLRQAHRHPASGLLAEWIPVEGGGVLLVSPALQPDAHTPAVYRLTDPDDLLELAGQWSHLAADEQPEVCLYEREDGYDLAVYPITPLSSAQLRLLQEYGSLLGTGEGLAAHCAEYGSLLATGNILQRLGGVLTEREPGLPEPPDPSH